MTTEKMVLVERNSENVRNGKRSRGPSPNGHNNGTPDSSSDDDSSKKIGNKASKTKSEYEEKIRVGRDYQAVCPDLVPVNDRKPETLNDRALLVWSPTKDIPENKLEDYINVAKEKYGYNGEQALGMLFWHKHDLERALMDLANFTPFPDEWTVEDKVLFEQAFQFHGKSFHRIRQMLPDKSIASLVRYYYSWKKTRSRTSVMDRQEKIKTKDGSENGSENGSNEESDSEEKKWPLHRGIRRGSGSPPLMGSSSAADDYTNVSSSNIIAGASSSVPPYQGGNGGTNNSQTILSGVVNASAVATAASITAGGGGGIGGNISSIVSGGTSNIASHLKDDLTKNGAGLGSSGGQQTKENILTNGKSSSGISILNSCFGCGVSCSITNTSPHGALCNSCFQHWKRTGSLRPTSGPFYGKRSRTNGGGGGSGGTGSTGNTGGKNSTDRHKRKPPRGMYINHDDIVALAAPENDSTATNSTPTLTQTNTGSNTHQHHHHHHHHHHPHHQHNNLNRNDDLLASMDREINTLLSQVQTNKQCFSILKSRQMIDNLDDIKPVESLNRINSRWNNDELLLGVQGIRRYGKDFQTIAETIGTKSETQVRTFFLNYRRRYNLDGMLKEYEKTQQKLEKQKVAEASQQQQLQQQQQLLLQELQQKQQQENSSSVQSGNDNSVSVTDSIIDTSKQPVIMEIDLDEEIIVPEIKKTNSDKIDEILFNTTGQTQQELSTSVGLTATILTGKDMNSAQQTVATIVE